MTLEAFSVSGDEVVDETGRRNADGDLPLSQEADPTRKIRRYVAGESLPVTVRLNEPLLRAAALLPIVVVELGPASPTSVGEAGDVDWIRGGLELYWQLYERVEEAAVRACYLADRFGPSPRRVHYFVAEDPDRFSAMVSEQAAKGGFAASIEQTTLNAVAADFVPIELIAHLGIELDTTATVTAGFGFFGEIGQLGRLRARLERDGYRFDELTPHIGELRMAKDAPVDAAPFLDMVKQLVALSRPLGCSYKGEETIAGYQQFMLTAELPERYASPKPSAWSRLFGR